MCGYTGGWFYPVQIKTDSDKIYYSAPSESNPSNGIYIYTSTFNQYPRIKCICDNGYTSRHIKIWSLTARG